jgi:hypothetical protein
VEVVSRPALGEAHVGLRFRRRARRPAHQLVVLPLPSISVYAVARGHRHMFLTRHKARSSAVAVSRPGNATPARSRSTLPY